jgi:hypothetical protein
MSFQGSPAVWSLTEGDHLQTLPRRTIVVKNESDSTIPVGAAVELIQSGVSYPLAVQAATADSPRFVGVAYENIEPGEFGFVTTKGMAVVWTAASAPPVGGYAHFSNSDPAVGDEVSTSAGKLVSATSQANKYGRVVAERQDPANPEVTWKYVVFEGII